ncbi:MAG: 4-hydroxy-3-methylbut-2-en-1-yl diphosphate synthase [Bacteroidetes bacterium]|nr:MAG: 4-hydroxy-3-methylbut-2-en-1-yl diphosphate synthase [Bacteroidota bacterium]
MPLGLGGAEIFPPIWNIADAAISIGVIWIAFHQKSFFDTESYKAIKKSIPNSTRYKRRSSRKVMVGNLSLGGDAPIRIQSMTTTDTLDVEASIKQSLSMIKAGSELVRLTAPSIRDADALEEIVEGIRKAGFDTPIVADIHFTPNAASRAADFVEKIRVNPGNYADKKKFDVHEYTDESYKLELDRIREKFTPLVLKCKELKRVMRIGTNHGSLSDRITSRFGDTPLGMVESALEFLRIAEECEYYEMVISMKSSNTIVMVQAYRLLVERMEEEGMNYPLHLGVTEAGDGEDGRIKSAVGIGTLLEDGIGDTIRVSLTESPEAELPVARALVSRYTDRETSSHSSIIEPTSITIDSLNYSRRKSKEVSNIGAKHVPVVIQTLYGNREITPANLMGAGYRYSIQDDKWNISDRACDLIYSGDRRVNFKLPGTLSVLMNSAAWKLKANGVDGLERHYPVWSKDEWKVGEERKDGVIHFISLERGDLGLSFLRELSKRDDVVIILETQHARAMVDLRSAVMFLTSQNCDLPVILRRSIDAVDSESFVLFQSTDLGGVLIDGLGDGVWVEGQGVSLVDRNSIAFGILQATRTRISKTEYISCPSCGRTLFDLEETTAKIRKATSHLKGLKIGIMGCIVNGPGEMADADYGYVGTGPGKITLYREKEVVKKNVPEADGVTALIELIKSEGDWVEPADTYN